MVSGSGSLPQSIAGINSQSDPRFGVPVDASMATFASPGNREAIGSRNGSTWAFRSAVWSSPSCGNDLPGIVFRLILGVRRGPGPSIFGPKVVFLSLVKAECSILEAAKLGWLGWGLG